MHAEHNEMEPTQIAVETLGGGATEEPQEALDLAVAAGDRLDVQSAAHSLAGTCSRDRPRACAPKVRPHDLPRDTRRRCHSADSGAPRRPPSSIAAREASPSGGSDRTAATLLHCSAVSSSILENQSRNRVRSIVPLPKINASRNPV